MKIGNVEGADLLFKFCTSNSKFAGRLDVDAIDRSSGSTPLHVAAMSMSQCGKMVKFHFYLFIVVKIDV